MIVSVYVENYCTFATKLTVRRIRCLYYIIVIILQNRKQSCDTQVFRNCVKTSDYR